MSLYDDLEIKQKSDHVAGWSSGIKLFQSQLQLKKASQTQPRREQIRKSGSVLAPVIDLKSKRDEEDSNSSFGNYAKESRNLNFSPHLNTGNTRDLEWNFEGVEYDPMWPNDYEKVVKDLRKIRDREKEKEEEEKKKRRRRDERTQVRDRYNNENNHFDHDVIIGSVEERKKNPPTGFAGAGTGRRESDSEDEEPSERIPRGAGVAIAPPPSLQESSPAPLDTSPARMTTNPPQYGASVAAKIMAKYGFKEGQGLGKKEQGISMALQVEKTSKRGGRIIHEKDMMPPPSLTVNTPPRPSQSTSPNNQTEKPEPSITEIMKSPSKVVLLRNMVGPREVDEELEPEVKEECNSKYGDVVQVIIYEIPDVHPEEAVRIFVEFKRIESAIKGKQFFKFCLMTMVICDC
uniref:Splicing factor 45 n=2 Tax=Clastoptera arizonana TaxID=38151 RepID=A0A1B6DNJ9_9HEMI